MNRLIASINTAKSRDNEDVYDEIYDDDTIYCLLFVERMPVARACVKKYSETM